MEEKGIMASLQQTNSLLSQMEQKLQNLKNIFNSASGSVSNLTSAVSKVSQTITKTVNNVIAGLRKVLTALKTVGKFYTNLFKTVKSGVSQIIKLFGNLGNRVKGLFGLGGNGLSGTATELRSKLLLLQGAFEKLFNNKFVDSAKNLMSSVYSLKNIVGNQLTQETIEWANQMERAFGLSATDLLADMNELSGVLYGLGIQAKDVAVASENILLIGQYLAATGAAGGDVSTVLEKLNAGLKGTASAVDDLGFSLKVSALNEYLKNLKAMGGEYANISTNISDLNAQERIYVTYASIIDQFQSHYYLADYANILETTTGRLNLLNQSLHTLIATVGTGLTNAVAKLTTYLIPLINYLTELSKRVFSFFGINTELSSDMNEANKSIADSVKATATGLDEEAEALEDVANASKKATGSMMGFDRINNLKSSNSTNSNSKFDYTSLMRSALGDLNALAAQQSESYVDRLEKEAKSKLSKMFNKLKDFISSTGIVEHLKEFWRVLKGEDVEGEGLWYDFLNLLESLRRIVITLSSAIGKLLGRFLDFTKSELLPWLNSQLSRLADWLDAHKEQIVNLLTILGKIAWTGFKVFVELVSQLINLIVEHPGVVVAFFASLLALKVGAWFANVVSKGLLLGAVLKALGVSGALGGVLAGFAELLPIIAAVVAAIGILTAGIADLWNTSESFRNTITALFDYLKQSVTEAWERLKTALSGLHEALSKLYAKYKESPLDELLERIVDILASSLIGTLTSIIDIATTGLEASIKLLSNLIDIVSGAIEVFTGLAEVVEGIFSFDGDKILGGFSKITEGIVEQVKAMIQSIVDVISGGFGMFSNDGMLGAAQTFIGSLTGQRTAQAVVTSASVGVNTAATASNNAGLGNSISKTLEESTSNGMADILNQQGRQGGNTNITIDGFGLIDSSTLSELARMLAPHTKQNAINIANSGFSI